VIYIVKNSINTVCLTLAESVEVGTPVYVFEFLNEFNVNATPITWQPTDLSQYTERFNLFELNEPVDLELIAGQYSYVVKVDDVVIEEGRMVVELDSEINSIYL
jgi:hypothetical protein